MDDDVSVWRLRVTAFDADPAGRRLNADLAALGHGAAVVLELRFPDDYPASPFFLRVVQPRMHMYSGGCWGGCRGGCWGAAAPCGRAGGAEGMLLLVS